MADKKKDATTPFDEPQPKKKRKAPVTMAEVFDEETRIVRLLLKRIAALPNETSRMRVLQRVYELKEFPLVDLQTSAV